MNPRIRLNKELLPREASDRILAQITEGDCHLLGRTQPGGIDDRCRRIVPQHRLRRTGPIPGQFMGHGSCLLLKFVRRKSPCAGCTASPIIEQLNWLFQNSGKFKDMAAEWPKKRKGAK